MRYVDLKLAGIFFALVVVSVVLSIVFTNVVPIEVYLPKLDTSQIFKLEPGVSIDEHIQSKKEEWERRVKQLKSEDLEKQYSRALKSEHKRGLAISWLPWLVIPFFLYIGRREIYILTGVLSLSLLLDIVFWFEIPVFVAALCLGIWLTKKKLAKPMMQ